MCSFLMSSSKSTRPGSAAVTRSCDKGVQSGCMYFIMEHLARDESIKELSHSYILSEKSEDNQKISTGNEIRTIVNQA